MDIQSKETKSTFIDRFEDIKILQYTFDEFNQLPLNTKILIYYLSRAAISGRDIIYDQNYKHNLLIRKSLEIILENHTNHDSADEFQHFINYLKRIWYSNGIHDPFSKEKFLPSFSYEFLVQLIEESFTNGLDQFFDNRQQAVETLSQLIFDPDIASKGVEQDSSKDIIEESAVNFYEGVNEKEAESYYIKLQQENPLLSHGLNSKLVKENDQLVEKKWSLNGLYGPAIKQIIYWLAQATAHVENDQQKKWLQSLIRYYRGGDLEAFNQYNIHWLQDTQSQTDLINGFIETYSDPLGLKGTWESILHVKDQQATQRTSVLSENAQWFEDHAPIKEEYKKEKVRGITAHVVNVAMLGGESYPTTPIGVNLPNADWIRKEYGSKSITLNNITRAHHEAMAHSGMIEEFAFSKEEIERHKSYGFLADNLHTDLHECLGHGSGKMQEGVTSESLKNYQAPIEEARADLFALYFMMDPRLVELGIMPSLEAARTQYDSYIRNGLLTQQIKVKQGKDLEQAHMRNRQLIASWCFEKGKTNHVIEKKILNDKTYFVINDYQQLRSLFAELLAEIQRIKSEGDYAAAKNLVEKYGIKLDSVLHQEVIQRFNQLNIPPFTGFINPEYIPVIENDIIRDVKIRYSENYLDQMLNYSKNYSFLSVNTN